MFKILLDFTLVQHKMNSDSTINEVICFLKVGATESSVMTHNVTLTLITSVL